MGKGGDYHTRMAVFLCAGWMNVFLCAGYWGWLTDSNQNKDSGSVVKGQEFIGARHWEGQGLRSWEKSPWLLHVAIWASANFKPSEQGLADKG